MVKSYGVYSQVSTKNCSILLMGMGDIIKRFFWKVKISVMKTWDLYHWSSTDRCCQQNTYTLAWPPWNQVALNIKNTWSSKLHDKIKRIKITETSSNMTKHHLTAAPPNFFTFQYFKKHHPHHPPACRRNALRASSSLSSDPLGPRRRYRCGSRIKESVAVTTQVLRTLWPLWHYPIGGVGGPIENHYGGVTMRWKLENSVATIRIIMYKTFEVCPINSHF